MVKQIMLNIFVEPCGGCIRESRGTLFGSVGNGMVCCRAAVLAKTRYVSCVKKNLADANLVGG